ncbi:unnamed protein product [Parnassius apollo]|uniref:(apollo) hypothetical protein n=1 Tax=Parnassius apollo TaxID=110799 RepID=A0A8S3WN83_PARAO|nr:unnamed protein product [Parnassius apollo]
MDVHFVDQDGRRPPLNYELLQDVLGDGCQSDLDISDEETETAVNLPRLLDDEGNIPSEIPPGNHNSDSDSDQNISLTELQHRNQENLPPPANSCLLEMPNSHQAQKRPIIWKAITYTDVEHSFPSQPEPPEMLQYLSTYFNETCVEKHLTLYNFVLPA